MSTTHDQKMALAALCNAFLETVREAGPAGAPAGPMYAAAMTHGISLRTFEAIMAALVDCGKIRRSGHCYYSNPV